MRGRVPRAHAERIREGSTRNLPEPVIVSGRPQPVEMLESPMPLGKIASAWWDAVVPVLQEAGLLERIDVFVLALAASSWAEVVKAERVLAEYGLFQTGSVGQLTPHAATKIKRDALLSFERLVSHLALSPVARTRLGLAAITAQAMVKEMEREIGSEPYIDGTATVVGDDLLDVGLPGA